MAGNDIRVLLADDHPVYRLGLRALLRSVEGLDVVGEAETGAQAVEAAREPRPDVIVMDLQMPEMSGIEATRRIVTANPEIAVLVLTHSQEDQAVVDAVLAGARGYVLKEAGTEPILRAIRDVAAGEMILGSAIAKRLPELLSSHRGDSRRQFPELTDREHEILELMAQGLNNQAISLRLGIGDKRVRNCITEIYTKLAVADRPQAIIRARNAGLGRPSGAGS